MYVYMLKQLPIYDDGEYIEGIYSSHAKAKEAIYNYIKRINCYVCAKFEIVKFKLNEDFSEGVTLRIYSKEDVKLMTMELGIPV